jgi:hypothetical protein
MIIDNPEVMRRVMKKSGARPTHPGAETIIEDPKITKFLDRYSERMHELTDEAWKREWPELAKEIKAMCVEKENAKARALD